MLIGQAFLLDLSAPTYDDAFLVVTIAIKKAQPLVFSYF